MRLGVIFLFISISSGLLVGVIMLDLFLSGEGDLRGLFMLFFSGDWPG